MEWALLPLKKYADFSGRARRKEFWMFYLLFFVAVLVSTAIGTQIGFEWLGNIVMLGLLVPLIACEVRRMHDTDRSGWWILVPIANIIFLFLEGTKGPNRFGEDPKGSSAQTFN
jgi:uncharacterized membrane protein YhaH (DUF805 family)